MKSRSARKRRTRLTRVDWLEAGQAVLMETGVGALRLAVLTRKLKVSSGSFYHHFRDMDDYLGALAEYYNTARIQQQVDEIRMQTDDPVERMRQIGRRTWKSNLLRLDAAMRAWAVTEPRARAALLASEKVTLDFMTESFIGAGFSEPDAVLRARLFVTLQVAKLLSMSELEANELRRELFQLLSKPPGRG